MEISFKIVLSSTQFISYEDTELNMLANSGHRAKSMVPLQLFTK